MLVRSHFVQSEKRQVDMGLGHPLAWGDTAEESHPSHRGGLAITLPVNLQREARGLAESLLF